MWQYTTSNLHQVWPQRIKGWPQLLILLLKLYHCELSFKILPQLNICDISFYLFFSFFFFSFSTLLYESVISCFSRLRSKIERGELSLLDLRNYLFSRQALLLIQLKNEDEFARRCLSFLYNTLQVLIYIGN